MSVVHNTTRRIIPCDRQGCVLPARYQIVFRFWMIGWKKSKKPPVKVLTNFCACTRHTEDIKASDLLDAETKSTVLGSLSLRGYPMPDFGLSELEFELLKNGHMVNPGLGSEWAKRRTEA
jgi:hypothetical protein